MLKNVVVVILVLFSLYLPAQIPEGYYDSTEGLTGDQLKTSLYHIIKNHVEFPYTSPGTDVWDILKETDRDTLDADKVTLFYSGWSADASQEYNNGRGWTREHVYAKSHGDFGISKGAGTDIHHLKPADVSVNSARNNKDFDDGGEVYSDSDGITECKSDEDSWEPRDKIKGDVARMLFYMATRYEGENNEPDLELVDGVNSVDLNQPGAGFHGKLSTLLNWHHSDPVDSFEIRRNNIIFSFQNNRNPFIDHPEFAEKIWGRHDFQVDNIKIYLDISSEFIVVEIESPDLSEGKLYSVEGKVILDFETSGKLKLSVDDVSSGTYFLRVVNRNAITIQKFVIN